MPGLGTASRNVYLLALSSETCMSWPARVNHNSTDPLTCQLCYTRGAPLHLMITIENQDSQALDLVATTRSTVVCLVKRTTFSPHLIRTRSGVTVSNVTTPITMQRQILTMANWWPSTGSSSDEGTGRRTFAGEIAIPGDLSPGCSILDFELEVSSYHE